AYAPYAFFNILSPIVSAFYGFAGISIMTLEEDPASEQYVRPMKLKKSNKELQEYIENYQKKHNVHA
ncbi:MAG TPA: hypothetical protein DC038_05525, partial [Clostridiales bacterium]|nr:hypothetical protein [Clostridiales bacterium]